MSGVGVATYANGITLTEVWRNNKFLNVQGLDEIRNEFNGLALTDKKIIQRNLRKNLFYKGAIDGIWGKQTSAALMAYNQKHLNNKDLKRGENAEALLQALLNEKPNDQDNRCSDNNTKSAKCRPSVIILADEDVVQAETEQPLLTIHQVKVSYDAGDFSKAFTDAQTLAVQGNAETQLYLGKMYADGRGTLQVTTAAHMWFNIASMNGSDEAFEERKAIQEQMTPELINEAQKMAVACIKSDYKDCGLLVQPSENEEQVAKKFQPTASDLRSYFINQPTLQRKQMQYVLKKLGYYKSTVDGLWGKGTRAAVEEYLASNSSVNELDKIYESLTSEVDVPSYFAAPVQKKKAATEVVKTQPKYLPSQGYTSYGNPKMSVAQALDACKGAAQNAKDRASDAARFKSNSYSGNCYGNSYSTNCTARKNSPYGNDLGTAMAIGIMEGLTRGMAGKQAAERELKSCMAHYGWRKS